MTLTLPNIESSPSFDAQAVPDSTDWAAALAIGDGFGVIQGCTVSPHGSDMNVSIAAGSIWAGGLILPVAAVTTLAIGAASATDRKDIVVSDNAGTVSVVAGTACGTAGWSRTSSGLPPVKPAIPANSILLAEVYIAATTTTIAAGNIVDKTPVMVPPIALPLPFVSGQYYASQGMVNVSTVSNPTNGTARYVPFWVPKATTFDQIAIRTVTTAASAGGVIRLGIYYDGGNGKPNKLLSDAGTVDSTAAVSLLTKSISQLLQAGLYWLCCVPQGSPATAATTQTIATMIQLGPYAASTGSPNYGWNQTGVTGALADAGTLTSSATPFCPVLRAA